MNDTPAGNSDLEAARARGMLWAAHAAAAPQRSAIVSEAGNRTFGELNRRCNRLARALAGHGLGPGDAVAMLCSNRPEFAETVGAAQRSGLRVTPINTHLTAAETAYVVADCEARAFIADARYAEAAAGAAAAARPRVRLAVGGAIDGFDGYDDVLAEHADADVDGVLGATMLYTSGTTGRPKGVRRTTPAPTPIYGRFAEWASFRPGMDTMLVTGPLYHAAPMGLNLMLALNAGVGMVFMDKWDAEATLALIARHRVTHTHVVPTMLYRMLELPDAVRAAYDVSSLRWVVHGAAPCPIDVKRRAIAWLGPTLYEYYAATEGGSAAIASDEWLAKPGSVGRAIEGATIEILDETDAPLPMGEVGTVYFHVSEEHRFEYFKAPEKTAAAYRGEHYTLGDVGYVDGDGYLFLTGRNAETIISGGVNIYPSEVDDVLLLHGSVADAATVGVPNEEWGEEVKAVVELADGFAPSAGLAADLITHCRAHLAHFKCPRSVDFSPRLPRLPTGKIQRARVRTPYWEGRDKLV